MSGPLPEHEDRDSQIAVTSGTTDDVMDQILGAVRLLGDQQQRLQSLVRRVCRIINGVESENAALLDVQWSGDRLRLVPQDQAPLGEDDVINMNFPIPFWATVEDNDGWRANIRAGQYTLFGGVGTINVDGAWTTLEVEEGEEGELEDVIAYLLIDGSSGTVHFLKASDEEWEGGVPDPDPGQATIYLAYFSTAGDEPVPTYMNPGVKYNVVVAPPEDGEYYLTRIAEEGEIVLGMWHEIEEGVCEVEEEE